MATAVSVARYWQEPDETDQHLAEPPRANELRAVAEEIAGSAAASWRHDGGSDEPLTVPA